MTAVTERGTSGGTVVGIDVSETRLDTFADGSQVHTFANAGEGTAALLEWLAAQRVAFVVCDSPAATRSLWRAACVKGSLPCTWLIPTRCGPSP